MFICGNLCKIKKSLGGRYILAVGVSPRTYNEWHYLSPVGATLRQQFMFICGNSCKIKKVPVRGRYILAVGVNPRTNNEWQYLSPVGATLRQPIPCRPYRALMVSTSSHRGLTSTAIILRPWQGLMHNYFKHIDIIDVHLWPFMWKKQFTAINVKLLWTWIDIN